MEKAKSMLKLATLINFILAGIIGTSSMLWTFVLVISGMILLSYTTLSNEKLSEKKVPLIVIAIVLFLFNIISFIFILISVDHISAQAKEDMATNENKQMNKDTKRIDLLLKLGTVMILISGVLFTITNWNVVPDFVKVIALFLMSGLFFLLSKFSDTYLKIEKTTFVYSLLAVSFLLLSWIAIGYFQIFSEWFSYQGAGKMLVYSITFLLTGVVCFYLGRKFDKKEYQSLAIFLFYPVCFSILLFFQIKLIMVLLIMSICSFLINLILRNQKDSPLLMINQVISYIYIFIILTHITKQDSLLLLLSSILTMFNLGLITIQQKENMNNVFTVLIGNLVMIVNCVHFNLSLITMIVLLTLLAILIHLNPYYQEKSFVLTSDIFYLFFIPCLLIFGTIIKTYPLDLLFGGSLYLIANVISSIRWYQKDNNSIHQKAQPFAIYVFLCTLFHFIDYSMMELGSLTIYYALSIIYLLIHFVVKEKNMKREYYFSLLITTIIGVFQNLYVLDKWLSLFFICVAVYLYFSQKENKRLQIFTYILLLYNIYASFVTIDLLGLPRVYHALLVMMVYAIFLILLQDNQKKTITSIALVVPMTTFLNAISIDGNVRQILNNMFHIYILLLVIRLLVKEQTKKDLPTTIGVGILLLEVIFSDSILITLYVGMVGILLILFGYYRKEYKNLFNLGIIVIILNVINALSEYWQQIPFWLYLLFVGLFLVLFVTYKELTKGKEPPKIEQKEIPPVQPIPKETEIPREYNAFCPFCGRKNDGNNYCPNCGRNLKKEN